MRLSRWTVLMMTLVSLSAATTFLPWSYSGARSRSSFELIRVGERLFLLDEGLPGAVALVWKSMPLVAAASLAGLLLLPNPWERFMVVLYSAVVALGAISVLAVSRPPLRAGWGAKAALAMACLTFLAACVGPRGRLRSAIGPVHRSDRPGR